MLKNMGSTWWRAWVCALVFLAAGCDLFSVRPSEPPVADAEEDLLNFAGILEGTPERFRRLDYVDLFSDGCEYRQGVDAPHTKSDLIMRLQTIEGRYPGIAIEWTVNDIPVFSRVPGDTVQLDSVSYYVYLTGSVTEPADYRGYSDFGLVYSGEWAISYWYDHPELTIGGFSFFNPDVPAQ